jgi:hypothetical protein
MLAFLGHRASHCLQIPATVLEGLIQMTHAIETLSSIKSSQLTLLSPMELIRTAPWGQLLPKGFDQPVIGRWLLGGGLIFLEIGSPWQALTPLEPTKNQVIGARLT